MSFMAHGSPGHFEISAGINQEYGNSTLTPELLQTPESATDLARSDGPSDEELVLRAQRRDSDAFAELIRRHLPTCLKRASLLLHNQTDAEDEVQNAISKAFQCLYQFRFDGSFSAWLCRIVQNRCLMLIREHRQAGFVYVDAHTGSNARLELVDPVLDQEDELGAQQVDSLLHDEISRVPLLMRNVLLLRDVEGLPIPEVAGRLGLSIPATKSRLMRARKEMRARLMKHCGKSGSRTLSHKTVRSKAEYTYAS